MKVLEKVTPEIKVKIGNVLKRTFVKGVLIALVIFFSAQFLNGLNLAIWYAKQSESTDLKIGILGLLGGVYPIIVYMVLGLFRCLSVLYESVFDQFFRAQIPELSAKILSKGFDNEKVKAASEKIEKGDVTNDLFEWVTDRLKHVPSWLQKVVLWVFRRAGLDMELYVQLQELVKLSRAEAEERLTIWITESLETLVDELKPFWLKWLIPSHICVSVAIWFL